MNNLHKWHGLAALIQDGVEGGSRALEKLQHEAVARPLALLEQVPPLAAPAKLVHAALDLTIRATHGSVRAVNQVVGSSLARLLEHR